MVTGPVLNGPMLNVVGLRAGYGQSQVLHGLNFAVGPHDLPGDDGTGEHRAWAVRARQVRGAADLVV